MLDDLSRLLKLYAFFDSALRETAGITDISIRTSIEARRDSVLLEIARHATADRHLIVHQVEFLLGCLAGMASDTAVADVLKDAAQQHLRRLLELAEGPLAGAPRQQGALKAIGSRTQRRGRRSKGVPDDFAWTDRLADRIVVIGHDYRYRAVNKANAAFHGETVDALVGRASWQMTGEGFFETINKPILDLCFSGQSATYFAPHPGRGAPPIYWVTADPMRDTDGSVVAALLAAREVSRLVVPPGEVKGLSFALQG